MVLVVNGKVSMTEKTVSYKTSAFLYCLPTPFWTIKQRGYWCGSVCSFLCTFHQYCFGVGCMPLAFVMVNTVPSQMEHVLEKIREIECVEEAYMLYGVYDILAEVKTETTEELKEIILRIRTVKHVLNTLTLMAVS